MATLPTHIGRYEIKSRIGRGGMGEVLLARDTNPNTSRLVAIKLLDAAISTPDLRARFAREARALAALSHPNIVGIYDSGEHDGSPYIVMEYVRGETIAEKIARRAPMPLDRKLTALAELCAGLAHAHEAGLVHRDVKPSNLMVDPHGRLRILDFGIVRVDRSDLTMRVGQPTKVSMRVGTPGYMSPEQVMGGEIDHRSDIFSAGVVCYELFAYREAFPGTDPWQVADAVVKGRPADLATLVPELDPEIPHIVDRALEKAPENRYPDAAAMQRALDRVRARIAPSDTAPAPRATPRPTGGAGRAPHDSRAEVAWARAVSAQSEGARHAARRYAMETLAEDPDHEGALALLAHFDEAPPVRARATPPVPPKAPARPVSVPARADSPDASGDARATAGRVPVVSAPTVLIRAIPPPQAASPPAETPQRPTTPHQTPGEAPAVRAPRAPQPEPPKAPPTQAVPSLAPTSRPAHTVAATPGRPEPMAGPRAARSSPTVMVRAIAPVPVAEDRGAIPRPVEPWPPPLPLDAPTIIRPVAPQPAPAPTWASRADGYRRRHPRGLQAAALVTLVLGCVAAVAYGVSGWLWPSGVALTVAKPEGGTITATGIECGSRGAACATTLAKGATVELAVHPDRGFLFAGYTGDCAPAGRTTMEAARTCGATFERDPTAGVVNYTLTIVPPTGGTVLGVDIKCGTQGTDCSTDLPNGVPVTLSAQADAGYALGNFTGDCTPAGDTQMTAAKTCGAVFRPSLSTPATPPPPPTRAAANSPLAPGTPVAPVSPGGAPMPPGGGLSAVAAMPVLVPETPAPPPISAEEQAKNEIAKTLKTYSDAYKVLDADGLRRVFPGLSAGISAQFKDVKSIVSCAFGTVEYVELNPEAGTAVLDVPWTLVQEMKVGGRPKIETIARVRMSRPSARADWRIDGMSHRVK